MTSAGKEILKTLLARIGRRLCGVVPGSRIVKSSTAPADLTMRLPDTSDFCSDGRWSDVLWPLELSLPPTTLNRPSLPARMAAARVWTAGAAFVAVVAAYARRICLVGS